MSIRLTPCENCEIRFKVRKIHKPYLGMYKDKPIFHWHYYCPNGHYQFVRYWNEYVNEYYDRVIMLEYSLITHRKDKEKLELLEKDLKIAELELDIINFEVTNVINGRGESC